MSQSKNADEIVIPTGEPMLFKSMMPFAIRSLLVAIIFFGGISFLLPNFNKIVVSVQKEVRKEQNRIRLTGLFTTNPAVHMKISYLREESDDLKGAIMEIELAIGLLDLHATDNAVKARYQARLDELRKKLMPKEAVKGK